MSKIIYPVGEKLTIIQIQRYISYFETVSSERTIGCVTIFSSGVREKWLFRLDLQGQTAAWLAMELNLPSLNVPSALHSSRHVLSNNKVHVGKKMPSSPVLTGDLNLPVATVFNQKSKILSRPLLSLYTCSFCTWTRITPSEGIQRCIFHTTLNGPSCLGAKTIGTANSVWASVMTFIDSIVSVFIV